MIRLNCSILWNFWLTHSLYKYYFDIIIVKTLFLHLPCNWVVMFNQHFIETLLHWPSHCYRGAMTFAWKISFSLTFVTLICWVRRLNGKVHVFYVCISVCILTVLTNNAHNRWMNIYCAEAKFMNKVSPTILHKYIKSFVMYYVGHI